MALNPTLLPLQGRVSLNRSLFYHIILHNDWWKQDIGKITTRSEQFWKFPFLNYLINPQNNRQMIAAPWATRWAPKLITYYARVSLVTLFFFLEMQQRCSVSLLYNHLLPPHICSKPFTVSIFLFCNRSPRLISQCYHGDLLALKTLKSNFLPPHLQWVFRVCSVWRCIQKHSRGKKKHTTQNLQLQLSAFKLCGIYPFPVVNMSNWLPTKTPWADSSLPPSLCCCHSIPPRYVHYNKVCRNRRPH